MPTGLKRGIRAGLLAGGMAAAGIFGLCAWCSTLPAATDTSLSLAFQPWWRPSNFGAAFIAFVVVGLIAGSLAAYHGFRQDLRGGRK